jgi:hypothetical protein
VVAKPSRYLLNINAKAVGGEKSSNTELSPFFSRVSGEHEATLYTKLTLAECVEAISRHEIEIKK